MARRKRSNHPIETFWSIPEAADNKEDEPIFVLCASDKLAPDLIRTWIFRAKELGNLSHEREAEAVAIADSMERWTTRKYPG
jgi:hypothetical protein